MKILKSIIRKTAEKSLEGILSNTAKLSVSIIQEYTTTKFVIAAQHSLASSIRDFLLSASKNNPVIKNITKHRKKCDGVTSSVTLQGTTAYRYRGVAILVNIKRTGNVVGMSTVPEILMTVILFTKKEDLISNFFRDATETNEDSIYISIPGNGGKGGDWSHLTKIPYRESTSLFLPEGVYEKIHNHVKTFIESEDYYRQKAIPYHTGIILKGPPGTAKSSIIRVIASEFGRTMRYLTLADVKTEKDLLDLITGSDWKNAILAIEDIDAAHMDVSKRAAGDSRPAPVVTMSTLLNILDGSLTPNGLIVLATTNHIENLDPAIIRPGRFDLSVEIGHIGKDEFSRMATFFDHDPSDYTLDYFQPMSGAQMRSLLLEGGVSSVENYQKSLVNGMS